MKRQKLQKAVDISMIVSLPFLMAYSMIGEAAHEWLGAAMLSLFAAHHVLNFRWFKAILRGKYSPARIFSTAVDLLLCADIVCLAASGILLSRHMFALKPAMGLTAFARQGHMLGAYWGLVLMSLHLGTHGSVIVRRIAGKKLLVWAFRICSLAASGYGIIAFVSRKYADYMLMKTQFVFLNYSEPLFFFLLDQLAIIVMFAVIGYYIKRLIAK